VPGVEASESEASAPVTSQPQAPSLMRHLELHPWPRGMWLFLYVQRFLTRRIWTSECSVGPRLLPKSPDCAPLSASRPQPVDLRD